MMKISAAAAFLAAPWQPAHAQAIVGSIPEEFRGDWCQENTKDNIFKPGGCKLKAGSLSIDRMTLDTGRLSCGFDSGAASDGTLQMRMLCTDPEDKESLMYGAQLKLLPGKKIELTMDELHLEELSSRMTQEKMDDAFCAAMQRAIDAGAENTPTVVSKKPGTRNPKSVIAA